MTNPGCVVCPFPCSQNNYHPRGKIKSKTNTKTLEYWSLQSSENEAVALQCRKFNFMPFVDFFLSTWGGPVSELIIRHSQDVAKRSAASLAWTRSQFSCTIVPVARQHLDVYFEVHMLHQKPKLHMLSTSRNK